MFAKRFLSILICILLSACCLLTGVGCDDGTFIVRFDSGATDAVLYYGEQEQRVKSSAELEEPIFIRPGYNFVGWNKSISRIEQSTTVVAQWKKYSFEVVFNGNGGKDGLGNKTVVVQADSAVELMEKAPQFVKLGYSLSWSVDLAGIQGNCTVDAVWTLEEYELTFKNASGGDFANNTLKVNYNEQIQDLSISAPAVSGKRFACWVDENGLPLDKGVVWDKAEGDTFYPQMIAENDFVIFYDLNGASRQNLVHSYSASQDQNECVLVDPVRVGYAFNGWKINGGQTTYFSKDLALKYFKVEGQYADVHLVAQWESRPYELSFETDGGMLSSSNSKQVEYGNVIGELPTAQKEGYVFVGWFYDDELVKETDLWLVPEDTILTARYRAKYKIQFSLSSTVSTDGAILRCKLLRWGSVINDGQTDFENVIIEIEQGQSLYSAMGFDKMPVVDPIEEETVNEYSFGNDWLWVDDAGNRHIVNCSTIFNEQNFDGVLGGQTILLMPYCKTTWSPRY